MIKEMQKDLALLRTNIIKAKAATINDNNLPELIQVLVELNTIAMAHKDRYGFCRCGCGLLLCDFGFLDFARGGPARPQVPGRNHQQPEKHQRRQPYSRTASPRRRSPCRAFDGVGLAPPCAVVQTHGPAIFTMLRHSASV